jgi:hypothetical protein
MGDQRRKAALTCDALAGLYQKSTGEFWRDAAESGSRGQRDGFLPGHPPAGSPDQRASRRRADFARDAGTSLPRSWELSVKSLPGLSRSWSAVARSVSRIAVSESSMIVCSSSGQIQIKKSKADAHHVRFFNSPTFYGSTSKFEIVR